MNKSTDEEMFVDERSLPREGELRCPRCGGVLKVIPPSDYDVDLYEIRCQNCNAIYEIDVEWV